MDTRERLLRAGEKEISRQGHSDLSLRDVGRKLGLSNMAAYRHFKDKEDFLAAIADRSFTKFAKSLRSARLSQDQSRPLHRVGKAYFLFAHKKPHLFKLMFSGALPQLPTDLESEEGKMSAYVEIRAAVADEVNTSHLEADEAEDEIDMYAFFAWSVLHGYCFIDSLWFEKDQIQSEERVGVLLDLSMKTLLSTELGQTDDHSRAS